MGSSMSADEERKVYDAYRAAMGTERENEAYQELRRVLRVNEPPPGWSIEEDIRKEQNGGVYLGDRMKVMEEATRFYNFFHLRLSPDIRELPDHITTELEFLHYLTFREAEVRETGGDVSSLLRAERDFLARHLCRWVRRLRERLAKHNAAPFFTALVAFALAFFEADHAYAAASA